MIVISDTSPITNLYQIGRLELLKLLFFEVVIPRKVYEELIQIPEQQELFKNENYSWIKRVDVTDKQLVVGFEKFLVQGESEAIVLAKELNADALLIDEWKGRQMAIDIGLNVTGVIGILLQAKQNGLIHSVKEPLLELKNINFRISDKVFQNTLKIANEA